MSLTNEIASRRGRLLPRLNVCLLPLLNVCALIMAKRRHALSSLALKRNKIGYSLCAEVVT